MCKKCIYHTIIAIIIIFLIFFGFPCPFKFLFNIPCPACGVLHALKSLIYLDFKSYITCNFMAVPMVVAVFAGIHKDSIFKSCKYVDMLILIICFMTLVRYIFVIQNFFNN